MSGQISLHSIYEPWGGNAAAMARDIDELPVTVSQWRYRGSIPPRYWAKIISAAATRGVVLTVENFVEQVVHSSTDTEAEQVPSPDSSGRNIGEAA